MNLKDLCDKHAQQWTEFQDARTTAWAKIRDDYEAVKTAFGNDPAQMPESAQKAHEEAKREWGKEWGDKGRVSNIIKELQKEEMSTQLSRIHSGGKTKEKEHDQEK